MSGVQPQALVYIFPPRRKMPESDVEHHHVPGYSQVTSKEEECRIANSEHWFTTSEGCRKVMLGVWPGVCIVNSTHAVDLSQ